MLIRLTPNHTAVVGRGARRSPGPLDVPSGNPRGRPRASRFTQREQHLILEALSQAADETTRQRAIEALRVCVTNPRTVLKALELAARLNGELGVGREPGQPRIPRTMRRVRPMPVTVPFAVRLLRD
jgi:hypothetical protein